MLWNLWCASFLAGGTAASPGTARSEHRAPKGEHTSLPVFNTEMRYNEAEKFSDQKLIGMLQQLLPGAHRYYHDSVSSDIFAPKLAVQCQDKQRMMVIESEGDSSRIYFSSIKQIVATRYSPPGRDTSVSLLLFNYQNESNHQKESKERYQFIVEERSAGDLDRAKDLLAEFRRRDLAGIPCTTEISSPEPASAAAPSEKNHLLFSVPLSDMEKICAGEIASSPDFQVEPLGKLNFAECGHQPSPGELAVVHDIVKEKEVPAGASLMLICGNATRPSARRCDTSIPDFGNGCLAYTRARNSALELEKMLEGKYKNTIFPYGSGTALNKRTAEIYLLKSTEKKK